MVEAAAADEVVGSCVYPIIAEEHREAFRALNESIFRGASGRLEFDIVGLRGTRRSMETTAVPLRDATGDIVACLSITRDVTDRKRAASELAHTLDVLKRSSEDRLQMLSRLVTAQEDERQRIALDIHDDTIQKLTAVGIRLDTLRRGRPELADDPHFDALSETFQAAIARLRGLTFELRPPALDQGSLVSAVHQHLEFDPGEFQHSIVDRLTEQPSVDVATTAYRIIQEALANVRKHAGATNVEIVVESREGGIGVDVTDDGGGFVPDDTALARPGHIGLASMRERAELAGGRLEIRSAQGSGTRVSFWLPLSA
jgi:signal transduction histidine kinase